MDHFNFKFGEVHSISIEFQSQITIVLKLHILKERKHGIIPIWVSPFSTVATNIENHVPIYHIVHLGSVLSGKNLIEYNIQAYLSNLQSRNRAYIFASISEKANLKPEN